MQQYCIISFVRDKDLRVLFFQEDFHISDVVYWKHTDACYCNFFSSSIESNAYLNWNF